MDSFASLLNLSLQNIIPTNSCYYFCVPFYHLKIRYFKHQLAFRIAAIICPANCCYQIRQSAPEEKHTTKQGGHGKLQTTPLQGHGLKVHVFKGRRQACAEDSKGCGRMRLATNRSGQHNWLQGKSKQAWSKNNPNYASCVDAHSPPG